MVLDLDVGVDRKPRTSEGKKQWKLAEGNRVGAGRGAIATRVVLMSGQSADEISSGHLLQKGNLITACWCNVM